jgi:hypothetical protein
LLWISLARALVEAPDAEADNIEVPFTVIPLTTVALIAGKAVEVVAAFPLDTVTTGEKPLDAARPVIVTILPDVVAL